MRFGPVAIGNARGAILAHAVATPHGTYRKGTRLDARALDAIAAAGHDSVICAELEPGDVHEDEAARLIAEAIAGSHVRVEAPATGRSNLYAEAAGLLAVESGLIDALNRVDPAITVATRLPMRGVEAGRMVATVKIIPFAVPLDVLERALAVAGARAAVTVEPFRPLRVAMISTLLPSLKPSVVDKTLRVMAERLAVAGAAIVSDVRVPHDEAALAAALEGIGPEADLTIVFGASAVVDEDDVIPAALRAAGGHVVHLGMPVDPGNLLILGERLGRPVLGAPGCARSPRENGFDFVLERILAGRSVGADDIVGMGVGGLLMDIVSRPAPRTGEALREDPDRPKVAAVVLAAGRATRFGGDKLTTPVGGIPMVRRAAEAAMASQASPVIVVTGHDEAGVRAALAGLDGIRLVHNPDFADGQSTSLKAGLAAVPESCEAAVVMLADMPLVDAAVVDAVIAGYRPQAGSLIVVPRHEGRRGNPVLWSRRYFAELAAVEGDRGGRDLLKRHGEAVAEVDAGPAVTVDVDDRATLAELRPGP